MFHPSLLHLLNVHLSAIIDAQTIFIAVCDAFMTFNLLIRVNGLFFFFVVIDTNFPSLFNIPEHNIEQTVENIPDFQQSALIHFD